MADVVSGKVVIIGAGFVGATSAYALMGSGAASDIVLVDANERKLRGQVMDLVHGSSFVPPVRITAGTYEDCADAKVVVLAAGVGQQPGESRTDLLRRNIGVFEEMLPRIMETGTDAVMLVVTNPVDILTYATVKISGLPTNRVLGSGTLLDTARFRSLLGDHCSIASNSVHAYIIGEHGDSEVPAWSVTSIAGVSFEEFCMVCGRKCSSAVKQFLFDEVKNAASRIIEAKGATYYAVGLAVRRIVQSIVRDENSVLTVSSMMNGMYGIEDVCLSLPSVIDENGVRLVVELPLDDAELDGLRRSAAVLRDVTGKLTGFRSSQLDGVPGAAPGGA